MTIRIIILYLLNLFDLIATQRLINKYGLTAEANPFGQWLFNSGMVYVFKIVIVGLALLLIWKLKTHKLAVIMSWVLLVIFAVLTVYHLIIIFR
nr:MAG TPA: hypothetical protein [Caudoviricetes sp.]